MTDISNLVYNCPRCITGLIFKPDYKELATLEQLQYVNTLLDIQIQNHDDLTARAFTLPGQFVDAVAAARKSFPTFPALSRADNETFVCDACGTDEALQNFMEPKKPLAKPGLPDVMRVIDGSIMRVEQQATNPLPKGWIYRTSKDGVILVSHPLNVNLALTVLNPNHASKSLAEQVQDDTCTPHGKFLCSLCFNMDEPRNGGIA